MSLNGQSRHILRKHLTFIYFCGVKKHKYRSAVNHLSAQPSLFGGCVVYPGIRVDICEGLVLVIYDFLLFYVQLNLKTEKV